MSLKAEEERFANLYRLMKKTRKNKRRGKDSVEFEANWAPLLVRALNDRDDRTLRHHLHLTTERVWVVRRLSIS